MAGGYEVDFLNKGEFIVLSQSMVLDIIHMTQISQTSRLIVKLEELMSIGYIEYLVNIINGNRENNMFQYLYLRKDEISSADIPVIIEKQLGYLAINGINCFLNVNLRYLKKIPSYSIKINDFIIDLIKDKEKSKIIKIYNCSDDD